MERVFPFGASIVVAAFILWVASLFAAEPQPTMSDYDRGREIGIRQAQQQQLSDRYQQLQREIEELQAMGKKTEVTKVEPKK